MMIFYTKVGKMLSSELILLQAGQRNAIDRLLPTEKRLLTESPD